MKHLAAAGLALLVAGAARAASPPLPTTPAPDADGPRGETWSAAIARAPTPGEGCFTAAYPDLAWTATACVTAPARPYALKSGGARTGRRGWFAGMGAGGGNDYIAVVTGLISKATGSFPAVTGVRRETGAGPQKNTYSLQLNTQFFVTAACSGSANPPSCVGWQQFIYSNDGAGPGRGFMQYWLVGYGAPCPSGWTPSGGDCFKNSAAVSVPSQPIAQLAHLSLTGAALIGGADTVVVTTAANAYGASGGDAVLGLAGAWNTAEFNILGDGGRSRAKFNRGSSLTVEIALADGSTAAPACLNQGYTGETNNLSLGACTAAGGATPSVTFTEAH